MAGIAPKKRPYYLLFFSALLFTAPLRADVILTFDDVFVDPGKTIAIPNGYQGFDWDHMFITNPTGLKPPNGYVNGVVSAPNVAIISNAGAFYSPTEMPFNLESAYFTSGGYIGQSVTVDAYRGGLGGTLEDTLTFTVGPNGPTLEAFDWDDIDAVSITTSGGTPAPGYSFGSGYLAIDDVDISLTAAPEPVTLLLILPAIGFLTLWRRRRAHL